MILKNDSDRVAILATHIYTHTRIVAVTMSSTTATTATVIVRYAKQYEIIIFGFVVIHAHRTRRAEQVKKDGEKKKNSKIVRQLSVSSCKRMT